MRMMFRAVALVMLAAPAIAQTPAKSTFALWRADELNKRNQALSTKVGPDHSARETLADYGNHRFRYLYRDADGFPEQHDTIIDTVFVQSGEGVLQLGGTLIDPKANA